MAARCAGQRLAPGCGSAAAQGVSGPWRCVRLREGARAGTDFAQELPCLPSCTAGLLHVCTQTCCTPRVRPAHHAPERARGAAAATRLHPAASCVRAQVPSQRARAGARSRRARVPLAPRAARGASLRCAARASCGGSLGGSGDEVQGTRAWSRSSRTARATAVASELVAAEVTKDWKRARARAAPWSGTRARHRSGTWALNVPWQRGGLCAGRGGALSSQPRTVHSVDSAFSGLCSRALDPRLCRPVPRSNYQAQTAPQPSTGLRLCNDVEGLVSKSVNRDWRRGALDIPAPARACADNARRAGSWCWCG